MTEPLLLTVREAADLLRLSRSTVYEEMKKGRLRSVHIGRACRIPYEAVRVYVDELDCGLGH